MPNSIVVENLTEKLGAVFTPAQGAAEPGMPDREEVISQLRSRGAILFRGFALDKKKFVEYTADLTPKFMDYSGGAYARDAIDNDETVLSVTGNRQFFAVPYHGEMFYTQFRPTVLWFYCVSPPKSGGETIVCDGIEVYRKLSPSTRQLFEKQDIKYIRHYDSETWKGIYMTEDPAVAASMCEERNTQFEYDAGEDAITTAFQCSALTRPLYTDELSFVNNILPVVVQEDLGNTQSVVRFADDSKIPHEVIEELRSVTDELTLPVAWQTGDLVMVDNSRIMHGRNKLKDLDREINVRMSGTTF